jgi:hypothetical protein
MPIKTVLVNRTPVLTLWAAVVAERLGYGRDAALTLGKAVAGLNAQSKGRRLGIYKQPAPERAAPKTKRPSKGIILLGREVPVVRTPEGLRAVVKGRVENPESVRRYLKGKFGDSLPRVETAMRSVAKVYPRRQLNEAAFSLYEQFRPEIPKGVKGWGAKGQLLLDRIRALARSAS